MAPVPPAQPQPRYNAGSSSRPPARPTAPPGHRAPGGRRRQPGADRLRHAADDEVRGGGDPVVARHPQHILNVVAGQHREQRTRFGPLAHQQGIGQLRAEQQPADPGVTGDDGHQVGDTGPGLPGLGHGGHRRLGTARQVADHPVEDRGHELVLVGETLVEIPRCHTRPTADAAHRELDHLSATQQVQPRLQQSFPALGEPVGCLHAPVRALGNGGGHAHHLDTGRAAGQYQETDVLTISEVQP